MDNKPCPKCGAENNYITLDKRGVPEVRCLDCDTYICKTNATALNDYYLEKLSALCPPESVEIAEQPVCKYCTEKWAIMQGRVGYRPKVMNIKFCPMCGRELKPEDKKY